MKKLTLIALTLFVSFSAFAKRITCKSEDGVWDVSFRLHHDVATNFKITKSGADIFYRERLEGIRNRIFKMEFYEFDLGAPRYFDFDKRVDSKYFEAAFYLKKHPFGIEIGVLCKTDEPLKVF